MKNDTKEPSEKETKSTETGPEEQSDCRCKEAKGKTLPQLLKMMLNDLAFWKKPRA